jgi:hypothetical protein
MSGFEPKQSAAAASGHLSILPPIRLFSTHPPTEPPISLFCHPSLYWTPIPLLSTHPSTWHPSIYLAPIPLLDTHPSILETVPIYILSQPFLFFVTHHSTKHPSLYIATHYSVLHPLITKITTATVAHLTVITYYNRIE